MVSRRWDTLISSSFLASAFRINHSDDLFYVLELKHVNGWPFSFTIAETSNLL